MGGGISEPESSIAVAQNDPSMHMSEKINTNTCVC